MTTSGVFACLKWTAQEPGADPADVRVAGVSEADQSALEVALRLAEQLTDERVTVVTVGPRAADRALRDAISCGAAAAIRVDASEEISSDDVAQELAVVVAGARFVVCGDYSTDRGSGSVPAFLAHRLGVAQALGLITVALADNAVRAVRRLDGGRREVLSVPEPCVLSVEGAVADLRRASLRSSLASASAPVDVKPRTTSGSAPSPTLVTPFRPRARTLLPPAGDDALARIRALTDPGGGSAAHGETLTLEPDAAAARILAALREWGER